jgi:hypothetical protein
VRVHRAVVDSEFARFAAHHQRRYLAGEGDTLLQHARLAADGGPGGGEVVARAQAHLALAVVAEPARLQDRLRPELGERGAQVVGAVDARIRGDGDRQRGDEFLLGEPVLRHLQRPLADGRTGTRRARCSTAAMGTFSNS